MADTEGSMLSADDRIILLLSGIIAAALVARLDDREFQGMRSPRFESAMSRSLTVAEALLNRYRKLLAERRA